MAAAATADVSSSLAVAGSGLEAARDVKNSAARAPLVLLTRDGAQVAVIKGGGNSWE